MAPSKLIVEFTGTFFLVLTIGMVVLDPGSAGAMAPVAIGAVLMAMVYAGGHVSGAHYNPAVTMGVLLRGRCAPRDAGAYVVAQVAASVAASMVVLHLKGGGSVQPLVVKAAPVLISEALFTLALVWVVLHVATAKGTTGNSFYGAAIGFVVAAGAFAVGPISGGAFNPAVAVALGMMGLVAWADLWVHLAAEAAGAAAAVGAFRAAVKDAG